MKIRELFEAGEQSGKLVIFDIDDTLVVTDTKIHVVKAGQADKMLSSSEFTHYKLQPGEQFDFGRFRNAEEFFKNAQPIVPMIEQLKHDIATGNKVVMITARADFNDRDIFLATFEKWDVDMSRVHVYRAGNDPRPIPIDAKKASIIRRLLDAGDYSKVMMYDDSRPNLDAFLELSAEYPGIRFYAWHVDHDGAAVEYGRRP